MVAMTGGVTNGWRIWIGDNGSMRGDRLDVFAGRDLLALKDVQLREPNGFARDS